MKPRYRISILLLFLTAIGLLSLPAKQNSALRDTIAEKVSALWQIDAWLQNEEEKRKEQEALKNHPHYVIAKVIYRTANSFNSSLWVNVGSDTITRNSPVLSGDSVIGIVEYVGKRVSLVRLITDSALTPAVRVVRNYTDPKLFSSVQYLQKAIVDNRVTFSSEDERKATIWLLDKLTRDFQLPQEPLFLAKGVLQGYGESLWRAPRPFLKGSGFNYDFKDDKGPPRDLRTGESKEKEPLHEALALVQVGDLLVTSGLDGLFPEGLKVAKVHSILPLSEGAYAYDLIATPTAEAILDLEYVTILPSLDFDESHLPQRIDRILEQLRD